MSPLSSDGSERAAQLHDALGPLVAGVQAPVELRQVRRVETRIVLEHAVHGAPVAFEICPGEIDGSWQVEVVARQGVDKHWLARLGHDRLGPRRHHVGTVGSSGHEPDRLATEVAALCLDVLDRLAALGPAEPTRRLLEALGLDEPVVVVDVGANPLEVPAYGRLLGLGACRVVGFEPQPEAYAALQGRDPARELYFPHAIGEPGPAVLNVFNGSGFASMYDIDESTIDLIADQQWRRGTRLRDTVALELTALDDVPDLPAFDLLKIDVQGSELAVFRSGRRVLSSALCVVPEVSFFPLYADAPSFADLHQELLDQGFCLHKFLFQKSVHLHGSQTEVERIGAARSQLVDGDAVYLRDLRHLASWEVDEVKKLVLLATFVFDSPDLAVQALDELVRRDEVAADLPATYAAATYV